MPSCISGSINYCALAQLIFILFVFVGLPFIFGIWAVVTGKGNAINQLTGALAIKSVLAPAWILSFYFADITIPAYALRIFVRYLPDLIITLALFALYRNVFLTRKISWLLIFVESLRAIGFVSFEKQIGDAIDLSAYIFLSLPFVYLFLVLIIVLFGKDS